jgi:predicted branched-subunit amino acid permease
VRAFPIPTNEGVKGLDDVTPPASPGLPANAPTWTETANERVAYAQGFKIAGEIPALILSATGAGFGALAHDAGIQFGHTAFMSVILFATPAQVVLVDQLARGSSLWGGTFAVMLTAIRLLPMTVTMVPLLRGPATRRWQYMLASHFVAITGWAEAFRRLPQLPERLRMAYFLGMGSALFTSLLIGTILGYLVASVVPPLLTSALLFMTPLYFTMSLVLNARQSMDWWALGTGAVLGPVLFIAAPGFDLLLTGLIGGTIAYVAGKKRT